MFDFSLGLKNILGVCKFYVGVLLKIITNFENMVSEKLQGLGNI